MFDEADYQRAAIRLAVPIPHIKAIAAVESSGETTWIVNGKERPPVRFEAHWFGKLTNYRFNDTHPELSSTEWNPALAARTRAGAWDQVEAARALDRDAADQATSWGAFQIMGFHWEKLGYGTVIEFVDSMTMDGDDGQMDAFVRFIEADPALHSSLRAGDWDDVERRYNGGGYGGAYAEKMRRAVAMHAEPPSIPRVLRVGDKGADVAAMQKALGITSDGDFGPLTDLALKSFQHNNGLVVDGLAGPMTRRALKI